MSAQVGQPAPQFTLKSTKGATGPKDLGAPVSLASYRGRWLVLFFYRLDFTTVCPTEILAFSDTYDQFRAFLVQMGASQRTADMMVEMAEAQNSGHVRPLEARSQRNTTPTSYEQFVAEEFVPAYQASRRA